MDHRNSAYVQTVRRVYLQDQMTQKPSLSNLPIRTTSPDSQGHASLSPLYGILPWHGLIYAKYTSTSTIQEPPLTSRSPQALRHCANSLPIDASGIQRKHRHRHQQFCSVCRFRLDLTHRVWLDFTYHFSPCLTWFDSPFTNLL